MSSASQSYLHMEADSEWTRQGSQFRREEAEIKGREDVYMDEHEKQARQWLCFELLYLLGALRLHCGLQVLGHTPWTYITQDSLCSLQTEKPNLKSIWVKSSLLLEKILLL